MITRIILEGMFDGTLEQFKDCFFSNATDKSIKRFAIEQNVKCSIIYKESNMKKLSVCCSKCKSVITVEFGVDVPKEVMEEIDNSKARRGKRDLSYM